MRLCLRPADWPELHRWLLRGQWDSLPRCSVACADSIAHRLVDLPSGFVDDLWAAVRLFCDAYHPRGGSLAQSAPGASLGALPCLGPGSVLGESSRETSGGLEERSAFPPEVPCGSSLGSSSGVSLDSTVSTPRLKRRRIS